MSEPTAFNKYRIEREDRRVGTWAAAMDRLGLNSPLRPSEAYPEGIREDAQLEQLRQAAALMKCKDDCGYDEDGVWFHAPACAYHLDSD